MISLHDLSEKLGGKNYGHYIAANCLWHNDENPSMLVFEDGFRCLSCGASGNLEKLLKRINYTDFEPKISGGKFYDFRNPFSRWLYQNSVVEFCYQAYGNLKRWPDQACYLKRRGIAHLIDDQKLGYKDGWYIFPVRDKRGEIITAVARAGETLQEYKDVRYILPNDAPKVLYIPSWDNVKNQSPVYVTFGILDALVLYSMGLASVSGLTGKNVPAELFDGIRKRIEVIPDFGEEEAANKLASHLGWRGNVRRLDYPEDCKDSADIFQKHGVNSLFSLVMA